MSRCNFAKLGKHTLETFIRRAGGHALDKEVEEATGFALALLTSLMSEHLNLLAVELQDSRLFDSKVSCVLALELNVSEASSLTIRIELELARANWAESTERIVELLLGDRKVDVADQHVRLGLHEVSCLEVATDEVCPNFSVVKLSRAALGLFQFEELKETIAVLTLRLLVNVDDCLVDSEPELLYMLV